MVPLKNKFNNPAWIEKLVENEMISHFVAVKISIFIYDWNRQKDDFYPTSQISKKSTTRVVLL